MKKALLFIGTLAVAAAAGVSAAYFTLRYAEGKEQIRFVERTVEHSPAAGSHFTAYSADQYPDLTYAAENAVQAVVNIEAVQEVEIAQRSYDPFWEFFGFGAPQQNQGQPRIQERRAGGSGVIITEDGYIVTNNHVVENATKLRVKLNDGTVYDAKIIGTDPTTDIALIKIEGSNLPTIPFGSSEALRLGEWVLAIGSPFDLQSTITAGIVSAKARRLDVIPDDLRIESFIQTDAAVNPGNSGGALVNTRGELVGINTVIKSSTGSYIGYSFAVPESIVRKVVVDLKEYGMVQRALLGVSYRFIDQEFIDATGKELGIDKVGGVYVAGVTEDGAASEAGIRKGDIITAVDGVKIENATTLTEQIAKRRPNDKVVLSVKRGGDMKQFTVTLRNKAGKAELLTRESVDVAAVLGGRFADAGAKLCRELEIDGGVQVTEIKRGGLLERARVKKGFVITHINDKNVYRTADLDKITDKVSSIDGIYPDGRAASYVIVQ
ncbi:MAG: trypsin-like peptidase domain-containing protein [Alistipes sp.]|nr:trypsin-like peptidase domain-containing protein [Alistipes sp.]